jgi:crotonobetainyl-CoA:carnitine CoA-transferase CaiB-like acyl-CoA transferase
MASALDGVRVIDFGQYIAGPLAAMLLADQGADVVRVDPPGGPRFHTPANATWNRGKRSIVLDLKSDAGRETARQLVASADVVIENFRPGVMQRLGLDAATLCAADPRLIYVSLPGFAHDDPRSGVTAWEGVVSATAALYTRPADPIFTAIPIASGYAAFLGAASVAMALNARVRDGLGQRIEVPLYDAMFTAIGYRAQRVRNAPMPELGIQGPRAAWFGEHKTKDGRWLYFHLGNKNALDLIDAAGAREWWQESDARDQVDALFASKTAQEWEDLAAQVGTEAAICTSSAEWLQHPHARGSKMIVEVEDRKYGRMLQPGVAVRLSATPGAIRGPAPALDADRESVLRDAATPRPPARSAPESPLRAALQGVKVLDLCIVLAGPTCGRTLAEFGANVIKIDGPARPSVLGGRPDPNVPNSFNIEVNRGKRSIVLDLKTPEGQEVFWKLAADADVIVENYRRGVIDRLGVGYEQVRQRRPDIVYASLNAYGYEGPWSGRPGHEQLAQTATGMSARFGGDDRPVLQPVALNDFGTGLLGAYAVALALLHKRQTGEGQWVNGALSYTACTLQSLFLQDYAGKTWTEPRGQDAQGFGPLQRIYRAADGYLFLGARDDQRPALGSVLGASLEGAEGEALTALLAETFAAQPVAEWVERLTAAGIGAQPLTTIRQMMDDPWAQTHGLSLTRDHDGFGPIDTIGPAPRLSRTPVVPGRPAPRYGADTAAILAEHGLDGDEPRLAAAGAVRSSL